MPSSGRPVPSATAAKPGPEPDDWRVEIQDARPDLNDDGVVGTYLDAIVDHHRERSRSDGRDLADLISAASGEGPCRGFTDALSGSDEMRVIAEVKRRSPSKGDLFGDLDPQDLARQYAAGGAACMSVLTDGPHFGGSSADLQAARGAVDLPVIRKDFTVDLRDICDARLMGADCVLLIVAALDDAELADFHALAAELGLDALVETHDEAEVEQALAVGAAGHESGVGMFTGAIVRDRPRGPGWRTPGAVGHRPPD